MPQSLFVVVIFEIGSCFFAWLDGDSPVYASHSRWDDRHAPSHPAFSVDKVLVNVLLRWA
jgi:hypothetical protein